MKYPILLLIIISFFGCGSKSNQIKSYDDYFPPISEVEKIEETRDVVPHISNEVISSLPDAVIVPDKVEEPAVVVEPEVIIDITSPAPSKSRCKAKVAVGPRKIGNPYVVAGIKYYPVSSADGYSETGVASWYGPGFHGKLTANGEKYNQKAMTAAHKTLPLPTLVRVENLENGKEIIVRVNDRGPFSKGRIIDLTEEGARRIGMIDKGTAKVRVSVLSEDADCLITGGVEVDIDKGNFAVQIAAFANADNAKKLAERFGRKAVIEKGYVSGVEWNRVWVTGYTSKQAALRAVEELGFEFPGAFVIGR